MINNKIAIKTVIGAFCFTWFLWGSIVVANQFGYFKNGTPSSMTIFIMGGIAPTVVAIILILKNKIMPVKQLFRTIFDIKQPIIFYLLVAGFMALLVTAGTILGTFTLFSPVYLLMFPIMIIGGGLEEVCWRFLLQPSLEKKLPFAIATSITAIIWSLWHLPLFFIEGKIQYYLNFGLYAIFLFGLAFVLAAIYRLSKSVWLCVLFHALVNTMFEDNSFSIKLADFEKDFASVVITSAILIAASCLAVTIANSLRKRSA
jgi:membrane protease YdiL (CAAX protease family)